MSRNTRQQYARCVATLCLELAAYCAGPGVVDAGQFGGPGPVLLGPPGPVAFLSPATHVSSAQTTFAVRCWPVAYQPHLLLNASTSSKPRPPAVSPSGSARRGGCGLASPTRIRVREPSDSSHNRTGQTEPIARAAAIELVASSETTCSAASIRRDCCHSQSTCRVCSRAHGTAPGSAPNARSLRSG